MKQTIYSDKIKAKEAGLDALRKALDFITRIPYLADKDKLTPEIQTDLDTRTARLKAFQKQTEEELSGLRSAHNLAIEGGFYVEIPDRVEIPTDRITGPYTFPNGATIVFPPANDD